MVNILNDKWWDIFVIYKFVCVVTNVVNDLTQENQYGTNVPFSKKI